MKRSLTFGILAAMISLTSVAHASTTTPLLSQEEFTVGQGDIETVFSLNPAIYRGGAGSFSVVDFAVGANYFLTDILAPGVEINWQHISGGADISQFLPNLKGYLPLNRRILPFMQVGLGWMHVGPADRFNLRIAPGVDFMLANNVALGFSFRYDLGAGGQTVHRLAFPLQFALYFKL